MMNELIERAKLASARLRIHYDSNDTPTVHIEAYTNIYHLELCGDFEEFNDLCANMRALLAVIDPGGEVPF